MLRLITPLLLCIAFSSVAGETKRLASQFHLINSSKNTELNKSQATYIFKLQSLSQQYKNTQIKYSVDGKELSVKLNNYEFRVNTTPGKHRFIVFINGNYEEMYSDSLNILGGYENTYNVYCRSAIIEATPEKPVIYLYPEKTTDIEIKVVPAGEFTFTYPEYKDGWNVSASSDGTILCNGSEYNYLFWESKQRLNTNDLDLSEGFNVEQKDILSFLEENLSKAGFTSKEKADFITYWGPRMIAHQKVFVQFIQNEDCDIFAKLQFEPTPDRINRFYMSWTPIEADIATMDQEIEVIDRSGFDVLEWGGQQLSISVKLSQL